LQRDCFPRESCSRPETISNLSTWTGIEQVQSAKKSFTFR